MKHDDHKYADKTPRPVSSEEAQRGEGHRPPDEILENPDPATETVDKVITPTSIKEEEAMVTEIERLNRENERKMDR